MKKVLPYFLILSLLICFNGCALKKTVYQSNISATNPTAATTPSVSPDIVFEQLPMTAVSLPVDEQIIKSADGTTICKTYEQSMSLIVSDPEVADKIILDFLNRIDNKEDADALVAAAKAAYAANPQNWTPYLSQISYKPERIDQAILSMTGSRVTYDGLPHPEVVYSSITYDLITGNALTLSDIMTDTTQADALCNAVITQLQNTYKSENTLYEGFDVTVKERFSKSLIHDNGWFFDNEGLCINFSPYEIAPYSLGVVTVRIPYSQLVGIVKDEYFPREMETAIGCVEAEIFDQSKADRFTQLAEVVIKRNSEKVILYTDQSVYDLRIQTGSWNTDGTVFSADHTILAAASLTPGDAIMVEGDFSQNLPTLLMTYTTNAKTVSFYVSVDKDGGTIRLTAV